MRRALVLVGAGLAVVVAQPASPPRAVAAAQQDNRAVVVVDTGEGEPRRACVVFSEPSITGLDALRTAQMDPVVQTYSGQGGAVCKLCGVGCSQGSSCLTCQSPKYWQYWRSVGGTGTYSYWRAGAGSTEVRDGDVEGWVWGEGNAAPPFYSIDTVCSDPARTYRFEPAVASEPAPSTTTAKPATTTTTAASAPPASGESSSSTSVPASPSAPRAAPTATTLAEAPPAEPAAESVTTLLPGEGTTTSTTEVDDERELAAARRPGGDTTGSAAAGYVAFAAIIGGLGVATVIARRRRARG